MTKPLAFIVEDDPRLNQIFQLALQDDFLVETVLDGSEAQARLAQTTPHLIVLDLNLPGVSGNDLLTMIRSDARLKDAIVIVCTANDRQADGLREQADYVLLKPVSPMQLRQLASRLV
ncbi:MAG: response regulator [Chloroflexi bacterium CFX1]|nr:response regulator [Chloroflexi bacterium CFX1]MCK6568240.1 response regulator [Anaerolineales bacterium]MCQ3951823.1 hypothetical protein [Chloroflexota bacterium]MDL1917812.1 response regulator [Chloroflexi bacterium CFX5]NUQ58772.1 response regulator [Anaerolineales bacterium]